MEGLGNCWVTWKEVNKPPFETMKLRQNPRVKDSVLSLAPPNMD